MLHDYLHCLVFKEQSVYRLSFQATHLSYRIQLSLSTSFLENFQSFAAVQKLVTSQGLPGFLLAVSVSDLYYDTGIISHCQHLFYNFLKKSRKKITTLAKLAMMVI